MYYIVTPGEIVVAQPCTKVDHVTWLLTHQKYEQLVAFFEGLSFSNFKLTILQMEKKTPETTLQLNIWIMLESYT